MKATTTRFRTRPLTAALVAAIGLAVTAADAFAATQISVTTASDAGTTGTCTLRQAIAAMNSGGATAETACVASTISGVDRIVFDTTAFPPNGANTITLVDAANNQLSITDAKLTIDASANGNVTVQRSATAANAFGIVYFYDPGKAGALTVNHLTIANGKLTAAQPSTVASGAGIASVYGSLTVIDSVVTGNSIACGCYAQGGGIGVYAGNLTLTNSTVSNNSASGNSGASGMGGGVFVRQNITTQAGGNATIVGSQISGNAAKGNGGGLHVGGVLTMTNSSVSGNSAGNGGGIKLYGVSTLTDSTISGNTAMAFGGGIIAASGYYGVPTALLTLNGSTLSGNKAGNSNGRGGGVYTRVGDLSFINSTIYGNSAPGAFSYGGGIFIGKNSAPVTMQQTTIASNTAGNRGGGLMISSSGSGAVTFNGSLFANTGAPSTGGGNIAVSTGSITIVGGDNLEFSGAAGDVNASFTNAPIVGDPLLGALANNGGPTQTQLPDAGSAAINASACANAPPIDQRGMIRPDPASRSLATACDIGAVEANSIPDVIFANGFELP